MLTPFAQVRLRDGRAAGCTSYCTPRLYPERPGWYATEIGCTPLAASAQRAGINTEAKLLLMSYAFETLGVGRVDLRTDARNERSGRPIGRCDSAAEPQPVTSEDAAEADSPEWPAAHRSPPSRSAERRGCPSGQ
jgi:RimJ/RimL family protein N-acetyltransferase